VEYLLPPRAKESRRATFDPGQVVRARDRSQGADFRPAFPPIAAGSDHGKEGGVGTLRLRPGFASSLGWAPPG